MTLDDLIRDLDPLKVNSNFREGQFCPTCLIKKEKGQVHIKSLNMCVKNYQEKFKLFDKIINESNLNIFLIYKILEGFDLGFDLTLIIS